MQRVKEKALSLLSSGTVDRVLGWSAGEFFYDLTPAVFTNVEDAEKRFVFSAFSGAAVSSAAGISASAAISGAVSFCAEAGCGLSSGRPVSFSLSVMLSLPAFYSRKLYHGKKSMSIFS